MAAKKVLTVNEQLYKKEVRRLQQFLRRAEKRGFSFPSNIIPKEPKKITIKSVQRLQKLTPSELYKKSSYTVPETGTTVTGTEGRAIERARAATKSVKTTAIKQGRALSEAISPLQYTSAEKQYDAQIRRINRALARLQERGYFVETPFLPQKPENITEQDIEDLRALKVKNIYPFLKYRDIATGQILSGEQGRKLERQRAAQKARETRQSKPQAPIQPIQTAQYPIASHEILDNVRGSIASWLPSTNYTDYFKSVKERDRNVLNNMLEGAVRQEGEDTIAARLESHATEVIAIVEEVLYGSKEEKIQGDFSRFSNILYGRSLTNDESKNLAESLESLEDSEPPL